MGLRSGDEDGHVINFSFFNPNLATYSTVERAACDGALSCIKIIFFLNAGRFLRYQGIKLSWRKFPYVSICSSLRHLELWTGQQAHCHLSKPTTWHHHRRLVVVSLLMVCCRRLQANFCTSHLVHRGLLCAHLWKERFRSLSWHTLWPIRVADFCAWWLRECEYSVSQLAWKLYWGSGNK